MVCVRCYAFIHRFVVPARVPPSEGWDWNPVLFKTHNSISALHHPHLHFVTTLLYHLVVVPEQSGIQQKQNVRMTILPPLVIPASTPCRSRVVGNPAKTKRQDDVSTTPRHSSFHPFVVPEKSGTQFFSNPTIHPAIQTATAYITPIRIAVCLRQPMHHNASGYITVNTHTQSTLKTSG